MIRYAFDLYPSNDPRDGSRVVRFTQLNAGAYRKAANGTGSGMLAIRGDLAEAAFIDPDGMQYIRVVRIDDDDDSELVVGGWWIEEGDFELLNRQNTNMLVFKGSGTLGYLQREVMWSHTYATPSLPFTAMDPFDNIYRLYAAQGGDLLGNALWRTMTEGTSYRTGATYTHVHATGDDYGETFTDAHDDDKLETSIPDVTYDFTIAEDSDGNDWTKVSGEFTARVGETILSVINRLMEAGLYVEMDPDTFEIRAWEADVHRAFEDRTGSAWASGTVRFQAPTDPLDNTTGNILADADRTWVARIKRSAVLAGGKDDVYGVATGSAPVPWHGYTQSDVSNETALELMAAREIGRRNDIANNLKIPLELISDPANGKYLPFEDVDCDWMVTVHTGSTTWDMDEFDMPVAAVAVELRPGDNGLWKGWVELGGTFSSSSNTQFQVAPVPASPTLELCRPASIASPTYHSNSYNSGDQPTEQWIFTIPDGLVDSYLLGFSAHRRDGGNQHPVTDYDWYEYRSNSAQDTPDVLADIVASDAAGTWQASAHGVAEPNPSENPLTGDHTPSEVRVAYSADGWSIQQVLVYEGVTSQPASAANDGTGTSASVTVATQDGDVVVGMVFIPSHETITDGADQTRRQTNTGGFVTRQMASSEKAATGASTTLTWAWTNSREWEAIAVVLRGSGSGSTGDIPQGLAQDAEATVGTSKRATRCDHQHEHGDLEYRGNRHHMAGAIGLDDVNDHYAALTAEDAFAELRGPLTVEEDGGTPVERINHIVLDGAAVTDDGDGQVTVTVTGGGHEIREAGTPLTQRAGLNFGPGFDIADDAGNDETDVELDFGIAAGQVAEGDHSHAGGSTSSSSAVEAARVTRTGALNVGTGLAAISWDNLVRDDGGMWNAGTPTRLTAQEDGWHRVGGTIETQNTTSDWIQGSLMLNGATEAQFDIYFQTTTTPKALAWNTILYLAAGDYIEVQTIAQASTALDVSSPGTNAMWMERITQVGTGSFAEVFGDGAATSFQFEHGMDTEQVIVQLWDISGSDPVEATGDASSITIDDADNVTVVFGSPPGTDDYRVIILSAAAADGPDNDVIISAYHPNFSNSSTTAQTANQAVLMKFVPRRTVTVSSVRYRCVTQAGNLDYGIYDSNFQRIASTGSFAAPAPANNLGQALTASVTLRRGRTYWFAHAASSTSFRQPVLVPSHSLLLDQTYPVVVVMSSAFPLPATVTPAAAASATVQPSFAFV